MIVRAWKSPEPPATMKRPMRKEITVGDIVDALGVADDEAHLALDAVKAVRLTHREKRRVEIRAEWIQATVDALSLR
jgi:hypothetical protein